MGLLINSKKTETKNVTIPVRILPEFLLLATSKVNTSRQQ